MTINAAKHHNYIVRAIGGEKIKYVNEIIQSDFRSMYAKLSLENRRAFWRSIVSDIHVAKDSTVKEVNFL